MSRLKGVLFTPFVDLKWIEPAILGFRLQLQLLFWQASTVIVSISSFSSLATPTEAQFSAAT